MKWKDNKAIQSWPKWRINIVTLTSPEAHLVDDTPGFHPISNLPLRLVWSVSLPLKTDLQETARIWKVKMNPKMSPVVMDSVSSNKNTAPLPGHRFKG